LGASEVDAGWIAAISIRGIAGWRLDRGHDVSNFGGCGLDDGLCLGVSPRPKVSMISIGDRQHGQGFQWRLGASGSAGFGEGGFGTGALSSSRALAMLEARLVPAKSP
jgi:hypothetical protein